MTFRRIPLRTPIPPPPRGARGFSLLEVIVALVILALVATALFRLFGGALGNAGVAADYSRATLVAESRLAAIARAPVFKPGGDAGTEDDGRIAWQTRVDPWVPTDIAPELAATGEMMPYGLFKVTVDVTFPGAGGRERTITLGTLRLARREGQP